MKIKLTVEMSGDTTREVDLPRLWDSWNNFQKEEFVYEQAEIFRDAIVTCHGDLV